MNEKSIKKHLQKDATLSAGALLTINYLILYFFLPQFPHFSTPILPQFYSNLYQVRNYSYYLESLPNPHKHWTYTVLSTVRTELSGIHNN